MRLRYSLINILILIIKDSLFMNLFTHFYFSWVNRDHLIIKEQGTTPGWGCQVPGRRWSDRVNFADFSGTAQIEWTPAIDKTVSHVLVE